MSPAAFEPAIPAGERPHTYALDSVAIGIGYYKHLHLSLIETDLFLSIPLPSARQLLSVASHASFFISNIFISNQNNKYPIS
jgi:hypothetical protein